MLLKILAGVLLPTTGRVEIYGDIARLLASGDNIDPRMTAHENIETSPLYRAASASARRSAAAVQRTSAAHAAAIRAPAAVLRPCRGSASSGVAIPLFNGSPTDVPGFHRVARNDDSTLHPE